MPTIIDPVTDKRYVCMLVDKHNPASLDFDTTQDLHDFTYNGPFPKPIIVVTDEGKAYSLLITAKIKQESDFAFGEPQKTGVVYIYAEGINSLELVDIVQKIRDGQYYAKPKKKYISRIKNLLKKEKTIIEGKQKVVQELEDAFKIVEVERGKKERSSI